MAAVDELAADLAATVDAKAATLAAKTQGRDPRSTVEPPRPDTDERIRHALAAWQALGAATSPESRLAIERTLGEGGMGVVHLAEQLSLGRKVAVKTLRKGRNDRDAILKLLREAWITGALEHPNVVPIYDVGVDAAGGPQIVLKRIEGVAWAEVMSAPDEIERRFSATDPLEWNLRILAQVCRAVHFAHARGVVHRDLKPENVMIGGFGEVYVLDWGIAVATHDDGSGRLPLASEADDMAGTPAYMAPEMLGGEAGLIGPRTDVYLLGAILHEIVTGKPPHDGPTMQSIIASIMISEPQLPASVAAELSRIITRAMARSSADRYASADEVRAAIEAYLRHRGSMRLAEDAGKSLAQLRADVEARAAPRGAEARASRRAVYNLLGECRFGYRAALVECNDNDEARRGLREAALLVASWELDEGDPESAALLLDEASDPPPALLARLEEVRKEKAAEAARLAKASAIARDLDKAPGAATRTFVATVLGLTWVGAPLVRHFSHSHRLRSHETTVLVDLAQIGLVLALGFWARESMTKTAVNRRLYATVILTFVAQALLAVAMSQTGVAPEVTHWLHLFLWSVILGGVAIHTERALWPSAVATGALFLATARDRSWMHLGMAAVDAFLMINMVVVWSPKLEPHRRRHHGE